jgi:dTDP-3,4-didehydro-2,6-dideoxy-alpha-D-glucose 3-reductase
MIRIGIICPSEIALRRFLPSLIQSPDFIFGGVAFANLDEWDGGTDKIIEEEKNKAELFIEQYGGDLFEGYVQLVESNKIDAVYLPLPPALHYKWAKLSLLSGKHVLIEKPATISFDDTKDLISLARSKGLAIHENYMFLFHEQILAINKIIEEGEIGDVRLYRISFGFPKRNSNDFRYNKKLGGGALIDCGGYTIKYASLLLGKKIKIESAISNFIADYNVDIYGSATMVNETGTTAQLAFGMDNGYKCELEVWGNKGSFLTTRVLTAPAGFIPEITLNLADKTTTRKLPADDAFKNSIQHFGACIHSKYIREQNYIEILSQSRLINEFILKSKTR